MVELWKTKVPCNLYQAQMAVRSAIVWDSLYQPSIGIENWELTLPIAA